MRKNICKNCKIEFTRSKNPNRIYSFCSYHCRAEFVSSDKKIRLFCCQCRNEFSVLNYYKNQRCCSVYCANLFKNKGKTSNATKIRNSLVYRVWRKGVFERDNYTCQICGNIGGKLNADHIKRFSDYPNLRLELSNGRTLCVPCHLKTDTFGNRKNSTDSKWDVIMSLQEV